MSDVSGPDAVLLVCGALLTGIALGIMFCLIMMGRRNRR